MGSKSTSKRKQPSPSPDASESSSSAASSSRSAMEVEEVTTVENSDQEQASIAGSDSEGDGTDENAESVSGSEVDAPLRPTIDAAKARTKLHHIAKTLRATAKKSKTFELQKLVKKLKGLQKKASLADQAALAEQELAALKSIETPLLAGRALITKMVKAKLLPRPAELNDADEEEYLYLQMVRDEELLGEAVLSDPVSAAGDKALEKAKAKITSSKVLADEVGKFVDELKKLAGVEPLTSEKKESEVDVKGKGKAKQDTEDEEERDWSGSEDEADSEDDTPRRLPLVDDDDDEGEEGEDAEEEELMRIGREKMKALGDLSQWDDMIGSDSGAESGSEDEEPAKRKRKSRHESDESGDDDDSDDDDSDATDSDSDSDSDTDSSASSSSRPRKRRATSPTSSSKKSKTSTFLPSLSTGFVPGRSDDEWSDAEADLADRDLSELKSGKKERKNRMGQRARKALYEKKYGSNANHIKVREQRKQAKVQRAPPARGGGSGRQRPPAFQAPAKKDGGWGGPVAPLPKQPRVFRAPPTAAPPVAPAPAPAPAKSQEMHPSWIAKQKQKELMAQVKPQGKKVVFD